jgi:NAD(P)-dependent dehydrogenase (short-subunit alcohol dehydrogenase family)
VTGITSQVPSLTIPSQHSKVTGKAKCLSPFPLSDHSKAAFIFSQALLPLLISTAETETKYPPTIIFTGATAGIKASAKFAAFASAKFGLRALSQSLAKEFGPKGVHVGHVVADGVFDSDRGREYMGSSEGLMDTDEMAEAYWKMHTQGKRAWTWEIDLRPYLVFQLR